MKIIRIFACLPAVLGSALAATPYHAATFSGVEYTSLITKKLPPIVLNNRYLIETYGGIPSSEVGLYDIAINDDTGEVDVISRSTGPVATVIAPTAFVGNVHNVDETKYYQTYSIEFENNASIIGTGFGTVDYDSSGINVVSESTSFYLGFNTGSPVIRGTCTSKAKRYSF